MTSKPAQQAYTVPAAEDVSKLVRDFAEPLLYVDPAGPSDIETVRTAMMLGMICWNLPVYEAEGSPLYAQGKRTLEAVGKQVPRGVMETLERLIEQRRATLVRMPFLVVIEVEGTTAENARITAQARWGRSA